MSELAVMSVGAALRLGADRLTASGCETPRLDAELLLADALGVDRSRLVIDAASEIPVGVAVAFESALARRAAREPVAYILGRKPFRSIELSVDPRVLIPRPETELLVEVGLSLPGGARVADVGTGSGAVALALASERPELTVTGIDVSSDALAVARSNGARLGVGVEFAHADLLDDPSRYDAVLANLPYVAENTPLAPEIDLYEPAGALFAGPDGLDVIRRLLALVAGGGAGAGVTLIALEIGFDQADAVWQLVREAGFASVSTVRDLAGHDRVVVGRR